jgi:hypothetical protein
MMERAVQVQRQGAEHPVAKTVYAFGDRAGVVRIARRGTRAFQPHHVHPVTALHVRLDHAMIATGREHRTALADYGGVASLRDGEPAQVVRELVRVAKNRTIPSGGGLERLERRSQSIARKSAPERSDSLLPVASAAVGRKAFAAPENGQDKE